MIQNIAGCRKILVNDWLILGGAYSGISDIFENEQITDGIKIVCRQISIRVEFASRRHLVVARIEFMHIV